MKLLCKNPLIFKSHANSQLIITFLKMRLAKYDPELEGELWHSSSMISSPVIVDWEKVAQVNWWQVRNVGVKKLVIISEWLREVDVEQTVFCSICETAYLPDAQRCGLCGEKRSPA